MKKGQVVTGVIEKTIFPNKGILYTEEGKQVIVKNTLPGQKVSASINKIRKGKAEGRLLEVIEKAENELSEAVCPHFGTCGGCSYQTLNYDEQITLKEAQIRDLLKDVVSLTADFDEVFEGIKRSPRQFGYRNKMEFSFGDSYKDGPLSLGMHKRGSFYDIVTVDQCRIVDEDYRKILSTVLTFFQKE
ncbi:MAG: 23S rRNA (uracil-5-)-methyltransferase RumA, partial [Lachnospiraceae bacterium]|nr:23S rRNA (uracil-5-)-methyltransferase RumA [Lachnospiraceae bacterium]